MKVLILSAVKFEANPAIEALKAKGFDLDYFEVGIGPLNAAKSEHKIAELAKRKNIIYLGSAGSYYQFDGPHLVQVTRVMWMPPCERAGIAESPEGLYPPIDVQISNRLDLPKKTLITTPNISVTTETCHKVQLPHKDEIIENMELYSCINGIKAAQRADIIMGITNGVGPLGRKQWRENFKSIAQMTADYLAKNYSID